MKKLLIEFEQLCAKELNILQNFGIDADIDAIVEKKKQLHKDIVDYFKVNRITEKERDIIDRISLIQGETEKEYKSILESTKQIMQKLKANKNNLNGYKINLNSSSFIDKSG
jgi:hypothetical protein